MQPVRKETPSPLSLAFRRATMVDVPRVMEIFAKSFKDQVPESEFSFYKEGLMEDVSSLTAQFTVAVQGGKIVGFTDMDFSHKDFSYLGIIGVDPAAQRGGIGKALIKDAEKQTALAGDPLMMLYVRKDNLPARAFYKKMGYFVDDVRRNYYDWDGMDAVVMIKLIKSPLQNNKPKTSAPIRFRR